MVKLADMGPYVKICVEFGFNLIDDWNAVEQV